MSVRKKKKKTKKRTKRRNTLSFDIEYNYVNKSPLTQKQKMIKECEEDGTDDTSCFIDQFGAIKY